MMILHRGKSLGSLLLACRLDVFFNDAEIRNFEISGDIHLIYELHCLFSYVFSFQFVSLLSMPSTLIFTAFTLIPVVVSMSFLTLVCMS